MKRYICILLSMCMFVSSCREDIGVYRNLVQEGEPVTLTLNFSVSNLQDKAIESRSGDNHTVNNIYLFIFEAKNGKPGKLKTKKQYTSEELDASTGDVSSDNGQTVTSGKGTLKVNTTQGECFIYAIANVGLEGASGEYDQQNLEGALEALTVGTECFDNLNNLSVSYSSRNSEILLRTTSYYLMSGMYQVPVDGKYTREQQSCIIGPDGIVDDDGNKVAGGRIRLYRMDAWVDFNINMADGITFTPTKYRVVNLPLKSRLMIGDVDITSDNEEDYMDDLEREITMSDGRYSFSFYLFENRKEMTEAGKSLGSWEYGHREVTKTDYEYVDDEGKYMNPEFKYAPVDATYIEIEGHFSGTTEKDPFENKRKENPVSGTTKYRIHLGDFSGNTPDYSDFNTLRNYHYTYNVEIAGVNDIIVEVTKAEKQDESASGATGEILFQPSTINFFLDSHFEVRQFTVYKENLKDWNLDDQENGIRTDFAYVTQTCYGESTGNYERKTSGLDDIYWVEFVRNSNPDSGYLAYSTETKKMNVRELLKELHDWKKNNWEIDGENKDALTYTVFVDEYYYTDKKIENLYGESGKGKGAKNWKDFCNQPNRVMYIGQRRLYSAVSPSTLTESICFISQRSIQTIYNVSETDKTTELYSAWGTETVNETPDISKDDTDLAASLGLTDKKNDRQNGYANQYGIWKKQNVIDADWSSYINLSDYGMENEKRKSIYACLSRNRDENGDGKITDRELKWYLPAIYQYGDLYLGELGIMPEARQYYKGQNDGWTYNYHMLSSTFENEKQYRNLAEEGFAFSKDDYDIDTNNDGIKDDVEKLQIRCVRNLGGDKTNSYFDFGGEDAEKLVQSYVQKNNTTINLDYLNDESKRRSFRTSELPAEHSHLSTDNNVYNEFEFATTPIEVWADEVTYGKRDADVSDPYKSILSDDKVYNSSEGWRAPSQRELMILVFQGVFDKEESNPNNGLRANDNAETTDVDESWFLCRTVFEWGGVRAKRSWIPYPNEWGTAAEGTATDYFYKKYKGDDPDGDGTYRYSYGILVSGTTFGLKQWDNYTQTKGMLCPVRDVSVP